jgi:hypothetical protein
MQPYLGGMNNDLVGPSNNVVDISFLPHVATALHLQDVRMEVVYALAPDIFGDEEAPIIHGVDPRFREFEKIAKSASHRDLMYQKTYK